MDELAWYGPADRYQGPPGGGMCISVFGVAEDGGGVLLGVPAPNPRWTAEWIPGWRAYSKEEFAEVFGQWRLPSGYLREGEHPDACISRVMRDQVGIEDLRLSGPRVFSYAAPSDWYPGNKHWDLVFVYGVETRQRVKDLPWWRELRFVRRDEMRNLSFGWNEDLMQDLKLVDPKPV